MYCILITKVYAEMIWVEHSWLLEVNIYTTASQFYGGTEVQNMTKILKLSKI